VPKGRLQQQLALQGSRAAAEHCARNDDSHRGADDSCSNNSCSHDHSDHDCSASDNSSADDTESHHGRTVDDGCSDGARDDDDDKKGAADDDDGSSGINNSDASPAYDCGPVLWPDVAPGDDSLGLGAAHRGSADHDCVGDM
jgi:hypothetical protein